MIGDISVRILQTDIAMVDTEAVVNAANTLSFTPMDGGVSGALRNSCSPEKVTGMRKRWWDQKDKEHFDVQLPSLQVGVQDSSGGLRDHGVRYVLHTVGPNWLDYPIADSTFDDVLPLLKIAVQRALNVAARLGVVSCSIPAVSGGIFTHWRSDSDIKQREQCAARQTIVKAVFEWVLTHPETSLTRIQLCDNDSKGIHMFVQAFDSETVERQNRTNEAADSALGLLCIANTSSIEDSTAKHPVIATRISKFASNSSNQTTSSTARCINKNKK